MINISQYVYNISNQEVALTIIKAITEGSLSNPTSSDVLIYAKKAVSHLESLLHQCIKVHQVQVDVMKMLGDHACQHLNVLAVIANTVLSLYNPDITEQDAVME